MEVRTVKAKPKRANPIENDTKNKKSLTRQALEKVDLSKATRHSSGALIIDPKDIPTVRDPDAPIYKSMEEQTMDALNDTIKRKQAEFKFVMDNLRAQSEVNKKILREHGIDPDPIPEGGVVDFNKELESFKLSESEDLEAELDREIALTQVNANAAGLRYSNAPIDDIDDEEFDRIMEEIDKNS